MNPNLPLPNVVCAGCLKFVTIWYEKKPQHVEDRKINIACCCGAPVCSDCGAGGFFKLIYKKSAFKIRNVLNVQRCK